MIERGENDRAEEGYKLTGRDSVVAENATLQSMLTRLTWAIQENLVMFTMASHERSIMYTLVRNAYETNVGAMNMLAKQDAAAKGKEVESGTVAYRGNEE
jgi:hypothetical protein